MSAVREAGLHERTHIIAGVRPLASAEQAERMRARSKAIPDDVIARLRESSDPAQEGIRVCADIAARVKGIEGVRGIHILSGGLGWRRGRRHPAGRPFALVGGRRGSMPKRYHVPIVPAPARFRPVGKYGTVDWREDCSRCKNCVKTPVRLRRVPDGACLQQRPISAHRAAVRLQGMPVLHPGLHEGPAVPVRQPGVPRARRRLLAARHNRHHLGAGRDRPHPGLGRGIPGAVLRARIRLDLDGHVGDRPPHARRHPRPRVHQHICGHRVQAHASGVRVRR